MLQPGRVHYPAGRDRADMGALLLLLLLRLVWLLLHG
jgi:hypothetical protein